MCQLPQIFIICRDRNLHFIFSKHFISIETIFQLFANIEINVMQNNDIMIQIYRKIQS